MADVNVAYRMAWAEANKSKSTGNWWLVYSIRAAIWATCVLNFLSAADPELLPKWAGNLTLGMTWAFTLFIGFTTALATIIAVGSGLGCACLSESAVNRDSDARKLYKSFKAGAADRLLYRFDWRKTASLISVCVQAGLLLAGGAMIAGMTLLAAMAWLQFVGLIHRAVTAACMEGVINPETVAWLEAAEEAMEPVSA